MTSVETVHVLLLVMIGVLLQLVVYKFQFVVKLMMDVVIV